MKGKKIVLNPKMIRRDIIRHWPIWGLAGFLYLLTVCFANSVTRYYTNASNIEIKKTFHIIESLIENTYYISFVMGLAAAFAAFGFLVNKKKDYFFEALPINKISLFFNKYIFGFILCMIPCFFIFFIELLQTMVICGLPKFLLLLEWMFTAFCEYLFWYSFGVLILIVCGRIVMACFCYIGFSAAGLVVSLIIEIANMACFIGYNHGSGFGNSFLAILSPLAYTYSIGVDYQYYDASSLDLIMENGSVGKLVFMLIVGMVLAFVSYLLFTKRKAERTGDNVVFMWMKIAFSYCLTFVTAITLTLMLTLIIIYNKDQMAHRTGDRIGIIIILCTVGFICFIESIMIVEKKFKIFNLQNIVKTCIFTCIIGLFGIAYLHDWFSIEKYVPKADEIEYIDLNNYDHIIPVDDQYLTMSDIKVKEKITELHRLILNNMDELETFYTDSYLYNEDNLAELDLYESGGKTSSFYTFHVIYHMKNDESISRRYAIYYKTPLASKIEDFIADNNDVFQNKSENRPQD